MPHDTSSASRDHASATLMLPVLIAILTLGLLTTDAQAQRRDVNTDESKVPHYELPDPLTFANGQPVDSPQKWQTRRAEILEAFRDQMYGRALLDKPELRFEVMEQSQDAIDGKAVRKQVRVFLSDNDAGPYIDLLIYLPQKSRKPVPTFLGLNFQGNHTIQDDPAIHITNNWVRNNEATGVTDHKAGEAGRGAASSRWPVEQIIDAGYGVATAYYGDIDPDFDDGFQNGVHRLKPSTPQSPYAPDAWGSIATWAWGLSCLLDYLIEDQQVDGERVALLGHSRLGKTSLWAGAEDTRFAIVISNDSGCGGAALSRRRFGETVAIINQAFPHWFCDNFVAYGNKEATLPFDQHQLIALIAPRPVYVASAQDDSWADPHGEFLAAKHASPVYELLGCDHLAKAEMPGLSQPLHTTVGYHIRPGKHDVTSYDWEQWIRFANQHFSR